MLGIVPVSQEIIEAISKSVKTLQKDFNMKSEVVTFKGMENSVEIGTSLYLELNERPNFMQDPNNPKVIHLSKFYVIIKLNIVLVYVFTHFI